MGAKFAFDVVVNGQTVADYSYDSVSANAPKCAGRALVRYAQEHAPKDVTVEVMLVGVDGVAVEPELLDTEVFDVDGQAQSRVIRPKVVSEHGFAVSYKGYDPEILLGLYDMDAVAEIDLGTLVTHASSKWAVLAELAYECNLYGVSQEDFPAAVQWFVRTDGRNDWGDESTTFSAIHSTGRNVLQRKMELGEGFDD